MTTLELIHPDWAAPARVRAVMTTRRGGVSVAPWQSLNLGIHVGDAEASVRENRRRLRDAAGLPSEPVWLNQVHGVAVADLDALSLAEGSQGSGGRPTADAAVARGPGTVCAIQVADCMPVLFAARDGSVVAAAHAGWRGLAGGVLEHTVRELGVAPDQIVAWRGPAIGPRQFEVGEDVRAAFAGSAPHELREQTEAAFRRNDRSRWWCDLYALARLRLRALGIDQIFGGHWCTFEERDRFFSYRRDGQTGRMAALIWLDDPGGA